MAKHGEEIDVTAPIEDVELLPDPHPARRPLVVLSVFFLLLIAVRLGWGWIGAHRMNVVRAELAARPIEESAPPTNDLAGAEAFDLLVRAGQAAKLSEEEWFSFGEAAVNSDDLTPLQIKALAPIVHKRANVIADFRRVRRLGHVKWPNFEELTDPRPEVEFAPLFDVGNLNNFFEFATPYAHATGDDAAAVEFLQDLLFLSRISLQRQSMTANYSSAVSRATAADSIDTIAPTLKIGDRPGFAAPAAIQALIEEMNDGSEWRKQAVGHVIHQGRSTVAGIETRFAAKQMIWRPLPTNGPGPRWTPTSFWPNKLRIVLAGPYYSMQGAQEIGQLIVCADTIDQSNHVAPGRSAPSKRPNLPQDLPCGVGWVVDEFPTEDFNQSVRITYRIVAMSGLSSTVLAIRLYAAEHSGRIPTTLNELVPRYLPSIPIDPYSTTGLPIHYIPIAARPFVYCVDDSGQDRIGRGTLIIGPLLSLNDRFHLPQLVWYAGPVNPPTTKPTGS